MKSKVQFPICILLCLSMILLCGCVPSREYLEKKAQGLYPDTSDFPDTEWKCREVDLCFYMLDYEENNMVGTYTVNGETYRAVGSFEFSQLSFDIYSTASVSVSEQDGDTENGALIHYEANQCGFINTEYLYENGVIVCTVINSEAVSGEQIPETLTFENTGKIAQKVNTRWYAEELDMYLDAFSDAQDYYKGEMVMDGQRIPVIAYEIGNNQYFRFSIENGTINNNRPGTTSPFVCMYFEYGTDTITARLSDEVIRHPKEYPYWTYEGTTITFKKVNVRTDGAR